MLPTKNQSLVNVDKADQSVDQNLDDNAKPMGRKSIAQFTLQARKFVTQNPFWVLLIGSVGIHAGFALFAPNPVKKPEPREVIVSTLPVVKLPPKPLAAKPMANKSVLSNLFVNSREKSGNSTPSNLSVPSLNLLELEPVDVDGLANLPPIYNDSAQISDVESQDPQFVQSQPPSSTPSEPSRSPDSGKVIDNSQPPKVTPNKSPSNLKPEFQTSGTKDDQVTPADNQKNAGTQDSAGTDKGKTSTSVTGAIAAESNEKEISNISALYTTDKQILYLLSQNLIKNTQIAPVDALISDPDINREKGVQWIPPKVSSIAGKKGSVTLMWLVDPQGNVETRFVKSSGVKELDDIAREAAKEYKFQPLKGAESGKYRLVTAKYDFP